MSFLARPRQILLSLVSLLFFYASQSAYASIGLAFQGLTQTVATGSFTLNTPNAITVDPSGNLYVADTSNSRIVEVNAQGVASVLTISGLSTVLSGPKGITIDGSGNLYIADTGNNRVVEVTSAGAGSVVSLGSLTLSSPQGVALDQSGDIFISDSSHNRIVEVPSGGAASVLAITGLSSPSTLDYPYGVAIDTWETSISPTPSTLALLRWQGRHREARRARCSASPERPCSSPRALP